MSLIMWECKKIFMRRSAKIAFGFVLLYALFSTVYNGIYGLASSTDTGAKSWDGPEQIAQQYEWAESWRGTLTGEKLAKAQAQYSAAYLPQNEVTFTDGSVGPSNETWEKYVAPLGGIPNFMQRTFSLLPEYRDYRAYKNLPIAYAENYYTMREKIVTDYLAVQLPNAADRAIFIEQNSKIETPFVYDWYQGQDLYLEMYASFTIFVAMALCVGLAPIFAGEYQQKTDSVLLCARFGRKKLARAKLAAALLTAALLYLLCSVVYLAGQFIFVGTRALHCPIQLIKPIATAPLTILQAEGFAVVLGLLGTVAITAVTAALSARLSSPFTVIIISLLILFLPFGIASGMPPALQSVLEVLPFASDYRELFRTNLYHVLGMRIWAPYMLLLVPLMIVAACLPIARRCFVRHQA